MKWTKEIVIFSLIAVLSGLLGYKAITEPQTVSAQIAPTTLTFHPTTDHTKCSLAQTSQADGRGPGACIAIDGIWVQSASDIAPWQLAKPVTGAQFTVNSKAADATGNIILNMSDIKGIITPNQDMPTRTCPVTSLVVGNTSILKLGGCSI